MLTTRAFPDAAVLSRTQVQRRQQHEGGHMANSKAGILGIAILAIGVCMPAMAENTGNLSVLNEMDCCVAPSPAPGIRVMAVSANGVYLAHLGPYGDSYGLLVRNLKTSQNKLILKDAGGVGISGDLSFSPDGTHLLFTTGFATAYPTTIWMIRPDGSELLQLANETKSLDATDPSGKTYRVTYAFNPSFSPDGSKVLVQAVENRGKLDQNGHIDYSNNKYYVALLSPTGSNQVPEILVEGQPLFWSSDGSAIYFANMHKFDHIYRYELAKKQSTLMPPFINYRDQIIGKVPGQDAVFVWNIRNKAEYTISVVNLDGTAASSDSVETAKKIRLKDAEGRGLSQIQSVEPHQLFLTYRRGYPPPPPAIHGEVVNVQ